MQWSPSVFSALAARFYLHARRTMQRTKRGAPGGARGGTSRAKVLCVGNAVAPSLALLVSWCFDY